MKKCILINSATQGQKARKVLTENGIKCFTEKYRKSEANGCTWCVAVDESSLPLSKKLLSELRLPIFGIRNYV